MNPYASYLADHHPLDVIAATPGNLRDILNPLSETQINSAPAPGKWSIREILCHLADCEIAFAFRIRQTLAEAQPVIQPFDQEEWGRTYSAYTAPAALAVLTAVRKWNLALIESLPPEAFIRIVTHPERGKMTLQTVLETMGGHDLNHLKQVESIASAFTAAA